MIALAPLLALAWGPIAAWRWHRRSGVPFLRALFVHAPIAVGAWFLGGLAANLAAATGEVAPEWMGRIWIGVECLIFWCARRRDGKTRRDKETKYPLNSNS